MSGRLNVSILYPNEYSYSETFIRNQIDHLPENVFPLFGGWFPFLQPGRKHLLSSHPFARASRKMRRSLTGIAQKELLEEAFRNYLRTNEIHVALAQYALTGAAVMESCAAENIPLVVYVHGFEILEPKIVQENRASYNRLFSLATKIIAVSQLLREELINLGCPAEKIVVNACGVDTNFFSNPKPLCADPNFAAVARFDPVKGPQYTLKAFHLVHQKIPEAKLSMAGDGDLWEECKSLAKSLNISDAVSFPGPLKPQEVLKLLRESRVFVQHGIRTEEILAEGMGLSVMEASSTGLPVVATNHGGLKESILNGETGILVEEGNISAMSDAMIRLAKDDSLAAEMGRKGRERMKEFFDLPKSIAKLDQILRDANEHQCNRQAAKNAE